MNICNLSLEFSSQHHLNKTLSYQRHSESWWQAAPPQDEVAISAAGKAAAEQAPRLGDGLTPALSLLRNILEQTFGVRIDLADVQPLDEKALQQEAQQQAQQQQAPTPATAGSDGQWGARIDESIHYLETETLNFSAKGSISTRDGGSFSFEFNISLSRHLEIHSASSLQLGANRRDPLLVSLGPDAGELAGASVTFDIDGNGSSERLPMARGGGWLALDRNQNGKIDDRSELFGPCTDDGFGELAALDEDGNGAVDSGDPLFAHLKLWRGRQGEADRLEPLFEHRIGALLLQHVDAPFTLSDGNGQPAAQMRKAGAYLRQDGSAGLLSQLDVLM